MFIESLELHRFRNLEDFTLKPGPQVNLILGENGQGKTNLLEAVWLCTGGKSFCGAKQEELPRFGEASCALDLAVQTSLRKKTLHMGLGKKRSWKVNGVELRKKADFAGNFICVAFSPNHLSLISGAPEKRRSYADAALCQSNRHYLDQLSWYKSYLMQKNALLKKEMKPSERDFLLDSYDARIAESAAVVFEARSRYVEEIARRAVPLYEQLSGGREKFTMAYRPGARNLEAGAFLEELREARETDLRFCFSSKGPHKDDIQILLDGRSAKAFGSQGQKRSAVLALKLAEASLLEDQTGESPVILLDDVLSELDLKRQDYLLNHIDSRQIFVTACEEQKSSALTGGRIFYIDSGRITGAE